MRDQNKLTKGLACLQPLRCLRLTPHTHTHTLPCQIWHGSSKATAQNRDFYVEMGPSPGVSGARRWVSDGHQQLGLMSSFLDFPCCPNTEAAFASEVHVAWPFGRQ